MSRYVDVEPKIAEIKRSIEIQKHRKEEFEKNECWDWSKGIQNAKRAIEGFECELALLESIPTADVRENVRGEWIKLDKRGRNVQCPNCGNTLSLDGVNAGRGDANYCPNCGADMRKGEKDGINYSGVD